MRKALSTLLGLLFLVFADISGQDLPIFPYKLNPSGIAKTETVVQPDNGSSSVMIPYLPTNFVSRSSVIDLWNNDARDSVYSVLNSELYAGGTFYFSNNNQGISVESSTGKIHVTGEDGNIVEPGVYTINYKYGNIGTEVYFFAPKNVSVTRELWKTGPSYNSDLTNSFMVDGKEFIYMSNDTQGLYIEMPSSTTSTLRVWGGDDIQIPSSSVWSGGVAEFPPHLLRFFNEEVVPQFTSEKEIDARLLHLSTVDYGKIEFDDVFIDTTPTGPGGEIKSSEWKGRIHLANSSGLVTGKDVINHKITQASFSENGNLFYVANHDNGSGTEVSELFFIPTLQILRLVGDVSKPVNPISSTDLDSDAGNLLNSTAIKIVDENGMPLNIDIGDFVIKNPSNYSGSSSFDYNDFKNYINGFGLSVDKNNGGIWNDNWISYLDPSGVNSKINSGYSLDTNWEFYFTTSEYNTAASDKLDWYTESTIYKAKLDLSDLSNIKLVVQDRYPLNNIKVPISGLGLDQSGCLYFIAGHTQFALVKIFGWGGSCTTPSELSSPFVVIDSVSDIDVLVCTGDTYDLTKTVPDFLKQPTSYIHPKGEPFDPTPFVTDPVYKPASKDIFDISYTDVNNVVVTNPKEVTVGVYRVWVKQADNGNPDDPNGLFDLQGKFVANDWFYEVIITDKSLDFTYPSDICSNTTILPTIISGNPDFGKFAFIDANGNRVQNIGLANINEISGEITGTEPSMKYSVEYLALDSENGNLGCADFRKTVVIDIQVDITNTNPLDITQANDATFCGANVSLVKPNLSGNCIVLDSLMINNIRVDISLDSYVFSVGNSVVEYYLTDSGNDVVTFTYNVNIIDQESPVITNLPIDFVVNSTYPNCASVVTWIEPTITDNCNYTTTIVVKDELDNVLNIVNGDEFPLGINTITYTATDDNGNSSIASFTVTVVDVSPSIVDISTFPTDVVQCDENVVLNDVEVTQSCLGGTISNDFNINNGANASGVYPVGTTIVTFTVTDINGIITDTKTLSVTVNSPLVGEIQGPDTVELGSEFDLSFSVSANDVGSYSWTIISGDASIVDTQIYMPTFKLKSNSLEDIVVQLEVSSKDGCTSIFEKTISVKCTPIVDISTFPNDVVQCDDNVVLSDVEITQSCLNGTISNDFNPSNGANASGVYPVGTTVVTFTVTDINGIITDTKTLSVTINPPLVGEIQGPDTVEMGSEFDLSFSGSANDIGSYSWAIISGDASIVDAQIYMPTFKLKSNSSENIVVQLEVTSKDGCSSIFEKTISVECTATVEIVAPNLLEKGKLSKFITKITGGEVASYSWSVSGVATIEGNSQSLSELQIVVNDIGSITINLEVVMTSGCIALANITLESQCILAVEIDGPSTIDDGFEFDLTSIVTEGEANSYMWSVVSGNARITSSSTVENITAMIEDEAVIQLEIQNAEGCTAVAQIDLKSTGDCKIPNVITPNSDGINDKFEIPCIDTYNNNHIVILDRWGKTVFETDNYNADWNGSNQNGDNLNGTYFYKLTSSNKSERTGYVVVVR